MNSKKKVRRHQRWDETGRKFSVVLSQDCEHGKAGTKMAIALEPEDGGAAEEAFLEDAFRSLMFHFDMYWPEDVPSGVQWPYELSPKPTPLELENLKLVMERDFGGDEEFGPDFTEWFRSVGDG